MTRAVTRTNGFDITVRPALGGQPELPPVISWEVRNFETPAATALFAEALTLAFCCRPATPYDLSATPALSGQHGIRYDTVDLARDLGLLLAGDLDPALVGDSVLRTAEDAYVLRRRRRSLPGRGRTHRRRSRCPAPRREQPAQRGMNPGWRRPGHRGPHREN